MASFGTRSLVVAALLAVAPIAQGQDPLDLPPEREVSIDEQVAVALFERARLLLRKGDTTNAKQLMIECIQRNPAGSKVGQAKTSLAEINRKLGLPDGHGLEPEAPRPGTGDTGPLDPYGTAPDGTAPLDPYAGSEPGDLAGIDEQTRDRAPQLALTIWGGTYGLLAGLAIGGPQNDEGKLRGGAVLAGLLGAGALGAGGYFLAEKLDLSRATTATVMSAGTWGLVNIGLFGDAVTGTDSDANDVWKFIAVGGLVGLGAGSLYALKAEPTEGDIAFANSLSGYGLAGGLMLGLLMDPPESEAYSLNAMFGSLAGITAGLLLSSRVELSREQTLWMDLSAATGALVPWILVYPFISDSGKSSDEQIAGGLSTLTLAGGAVVGWFLAKKMGAGDSEEPAEPSGPAIVNRSGKGRWSLGAPIPLPLSGEANPGGGTLLPVLFGQF